MSCLSVDIYILFNLFSCVDSVGEREIEEKRGGEREREEEEEREREEEGEGEDKEA